MSHILSRISRRQATTVEIRVVTSVLILCSFPDGWQGRNYGASLDELNLPFVSLIVREELADWTATRMWWRLGPLPGRHGAGLCVEKNAFSVSYPRMWLDGPTEDDRLG
jgi:hypothetical protein